MACTLSTISNRTKGFDFETLFNVYVYLNNTCPPESDIFFPGSKLPTEAVCRKIAGLSDSFWSGWSPYPLSDIWSRIATWKLPLFQLVAQFTRAPLGFAVESATLFHLLGDPLDSMTSMLATLSVCLFRTKMAKETCARAGILPSHATYHRTWKVLAIIMVSYDECGRSERAEHVCND